MVIRNAFKDLSLPSLGLGCMRLPRDSFGGINREEAASMIKYAMENGVNYFDTGYDYHGGESEILLGEVLSKYDRSSYFLADKFPGYDRRYRAKAKQIFEEQLERCKTDHFDFYLLHNVAELSIDIYFDPEYNIIPYLKEEREKGRITHLGFSAHGTLKTLERLLKAYGDSLEFAQIQLNYMDYDFQHAKEKIELLKSYGLPIFVMEPLRGGKLAKLPDRYREELAKSFPDMTPAEMAFRFVQSIPETALTLSGMSDISQLKENIKVFSKERTLSFEDIFALREIAERMTSENTVPCTGCNYCTKHCQKNLDIPKLIELYNEHTFSGGGFIVPSFVAAMKRFERPSECIGCKSCESVCPQNIKISEIMLDFCNKLSRK